MKDKKDGKPGEGAMLTKLLRLWQMRPRVAVVGGVRRHDTRFAICHGEVRVDFGTLVGSGGQGSKRIKRAKRPEARGSGSNIHKGSGKESTGNKLWCPYQLARGADREGQWTREEPQGWQGRGGGHSDETVAREQAFQALARMRAP